MKTYRPIPCQIYAELELAIMHKARLRLAWSAPDSGPRLDRIQPTDLRTQAGEEFLLAQDSHGNQLKIRLDYIASFTPL